MERQELDVKGLVQGLRRSSMTVAAFLVVGIAAAALISMIMPKQYDASSSVILRRAVESGNTPAGAMATEVAIADSVPVATRAQLALGIDEPVEGFLKRYSALARTDDVLVFKASATTADEAVSIANTLADEFLAYRREQNEEGVEVLRRSLSSRTEQLERDIVSLDAQIAEAEGTQQGQAGESDAATRLLDTRQLAVEELGAIAGQISSAELQATVAGEGSKVVELASPPAAPTQPNTRFNLILGALGGLALGVGSVVVREMTSTRLRTRQDIALAAGVPVLRTLRMPTRRAVPTRGSGFARAWRKPSANLDRGVLALAGEIGLGSSTEAMVIGSVGCDGEAGLIALRLAKVMADEGRRPLLVDVGGDRVVMEGMLSSVGLLADGEASGGEPRRWFVAVDDGEGEIKWSGVGDGSLKLLGARSRRSVASTKSASVPPADLMIVFAPDWSGSDDRPTFSVPGERRLPGLLVVGAGRSVGEAIRRHAEAFDQLSAQLSGVVVVDPDRFDETSGQLDAAPTSGPTPLRSRAVES